MDADLVIVGGGPAGLSTALFLGALSPRLLGRVLVLEKARYPRDKVCAGAVGARAERALASIGVRVDVPSLPVFGLSVRTPHGARTTRRAGAPSGRVVRRVEFDAALADAARARGVRVLEGAAVSAVRVDGDGVALETTSGTLRARAVVGADGVGSAVRRSLGLAGGALSAQVVEVDTEALPGEPEDVLHFELGPGFVGYAWDFPTPVAGERLVSRGVYQLRPARGAGASGRDPDVSDLLEARLERLGLSPRGLRFRRFAERGLPLHAPIAAPRAMLVGEAAGVDPTLGEGIAQAILYGEVAASFLAGRLARGDFDFRAFRAHLARTPLGLDLAVRVRAARLVLGPARPLVERWVFRSAAIADAGLAYFGGARVPRARLARAAVDLGAAALPFAGRWRGGRRGPSRDV